MMPLKFSQPQQTEFQPVTRVMKLKTVQVQKCEREALLLISDIYLLKSDIPNNSFHACIFSPCSIKSMKELLFRALCTLVKYLRILL